VGAIFGPPHYGVFAGSQALSGYAYPAIFTGSGGNQRLLFASGVVATTLAVLANICIPLLLRKQVNAGSVNTPRGN
jgi:hypothetical protein